jgi:hypothetical protein
LDPLDKFLYQVVASLPLLLIKTASDDITSANAFSPLLFNVPPVDTKSQMASA